VPAGSDSQEAPRLAAQDGHTLAAVYPSASLIPDQPHPPLHTEADYDDRMTPEITIVDLKQQQQQQQQQQGAAGRAAGEDDEADPEYQAALAEAYGGAWDAATAGNAGRPPQMGLAVSMTRWPGNFRSEALPLCICSPLYFDKCLGEKGIGDDPLPGYPSWRRHQVDAGLGASRSGPSHASSTWCAAPSPRLPPPSAFAYPHPASVPQYASGPPDGAGGTSRPWQPSGATAASPATLPFHHVFSNYGAPSPAPPHYGTTGATQSWPRGPQYAHGRAPLDETYTYQRQKYSTHMSPPPQRYAARPARGSWPGW
jgi:hypothetical protein